MSELSDKANEIADRLQKNADIRNQKTIDISRAENQAYKKACEDFAREIRAYSTMKVNKD